MTEAKEITPEACDNARKFTNGRLFLGRGDYFVTPKCDLSGIIFIGEQDFNGESLTTVCSEDEIAEARHENG